MESFKYYLQINSKNGKFNGINNERVSAITGSADFDCKAVRIAGNADLNEIDFDSINKINPELILIGDELIRSNGTDNFDNTIEYFKKIALLINDNSIKSHIALATNSKIAFEFGVENIIKLMSVIAGSNKCLLALDFENHADELAKDITIELDPVRAIISMLPDSVECIPIIGSKCYNTFSKSIKFTKLQISIAATMGFDNLILDLFNFYDKEDFGEIKMQEMLSKGKRKFSALTNAKNSSENTDKFYNEGIYIPQPEVCQWSQIFQRLGFPVKYTSSENDVAAFMGDSIIDYSKDEIINFLSHSVILDGKAACALLEAGYGEYLGVECVGDISTDERPFGAEAANVVVRDNVMVNFLGILWLTHTLDWDGIVHYKKFNLKAGAKEITLLVDPDREPIIPGWIIFENKLGGRVAIHSTIIHGFPSQGQYSWGRAKLMCGIIRWLSHNRPFIWNENNPDILSIYNVTDSHNCEILSVTNLSMDDCENVGFLFRNSNDYEIETILVTSENGEWESVEFTIEEADDITDIYDGTREKISRIIVIKKVEYLESEVFKLLRRSK